MNNYSEPEELQIPAEHWRMLDVADVDEWDCPPGILLVDGAMAVVNLVLLAAPTQSKKSLLALEDPNRRIRDRLVDFRSGTDGQCRDGCLSEKARRSGQRS